MNTKVVSLTVDTVGGAGAATGSATASVPGGAGRVLAVEVKYGAVPATTVVEVDNVSSLGLNKPLITFPAGNVDQPWVSPVEALVDNGGTPLTATDSPGGQLPIVQGDLTVTVTLADAAVDAVLVSILCEV